MDNRIKLLHLLADGKFHSGEKLGSELSVSRSAVWKLIQKSILPLMRYAKAVET